MCVCVCTKKLTSDLFFTFIVCTMHMKNGLCVDHKMVSIVLICVTPLEDPPTLLAPLSCPEASLTAVLLPTIKRS